VTHKQLGIVAGLGAAAALTLSACSSGATVRATTDAGAQQVTINATDNFRFQPDAQTVHVGTVQITLVDTGSYPHNIAFPSQHVTSQTVTGGLGKQKTTLVMTFIRPGTYSFECTYHSSAGMKGKIVVT
jgi:plastocyanin